MLEDLRRGDLLRFNATITHLAVVRTSYQGQPLSKYHETDESSVHHIHGLDIFKIANADPDHSSISQHVHWDGRYSFNSDMQKKDFD
jgi:hypothetical protein